MPVLALVLAAASLLVLIGGAFAWRLTSSRPLLINVLVSCAFLMIGAYAAKDRAQFGFSFILPFFATMVLGGRAVGLVWRGRKEPDLRTPGLLLSGCTLLCATATLAVYFS